MAKIHDVSNLIKISIDIHGDGKITNLIFEINNHLITVYEEYKTHVKTLIKIGEFTLFPGDNIEDSCKDWAIHAW